MHALPFSAQRSGTSTSLCTLENHRRSGDRCKGLTEKSMFFLSWLTARGSGMGSACLITDTDSPANTRGERWTTHVPSSASAHPCSKPASHTPQRSRAAPNIHHGDVKPTCHTGKPQALCSAGRIPKHQTHLTHAMILRTWKVQASSKSCSHTPSHPGKALIPASAPKFASRTTAEGSSLCSMRRHTPVRIDWSTRRVVERISMIRMSAGTLSPTARTRAEQVALAALNTPGMGTANPELRPTMCRCTAAPSLEQ